MGLTQRTPLRRSTPMGRGSAGMRRSGHVSTPAPTAGQDASASREQRLQERAQRAVAMAKANADRGQQQGRAPVFSDLVAGVPKENHLEHAGYRRLVASWACMHCGLAENSQFAHANQGKGFSLKTDDRTGFPLCAVQPGREGCHIPFDQYRLVPGGREAHRELAKKWGAEIRARVLALGAWPANLPKWEADCSTE